MSRGSSTACHNLKEDTSPSIIMNVQIACFICILFLLFSAGCTDNSGQEKVNPAGTVQPKEVRTTPVTVTQATPQAAVTSEQANRSGIFDQPRSDPPADLAVSITAQKDPVYSTITVTFDGGKGQDLVQNILVKTTLSTGESREQTLGKNKGAEITGNGTRGSDRVQAAVTFMTGETYLVTDTRLEQNRAGSIATESVPEKKMNSSEAGLYQGPVTEPPNSLSVSVDVMKEPIYRVITGTFRGGHGQFLVSRIEMRAVLGSGEAVTKIIPSNIGATAEIQGSDGIDRVQVVAFFKNGEVYKIFEKTFGSRG
jgi:hypothetical protein